MLKIFGGLTVFSLIFYATTSSADDALLEKISKRTKVSISDVKKSMDEGCSSGVTPLMNECSNYHTVGADIELNEAYQTLMKILTTEASKFELKKAQRAWISYRDAVCAFESVDWEGGSGYNVIYQGCVQSKTEERTTELQENIKERKN